MYGDTANLLEIFQAPIHTVMVWTGHCTSNCAVALRDKNSYVDLRREAKASLAHAPVRIPLPASHREAGEWNLADRRSCADGYTVDWNVSEMSFFDMHWRRLDMDKVVEARDGLWVDKPDLSRVDEIGFTELRRSDREPDKGGSSRVDWIEVYGKPVSREGGGAPRASAQSR